MIRSNAERSTTRSLMTGNGAARHGSIVIVSPSLKNRMCNWHTVVAGIGPCGTPLTTRPHVPQIPSRQSLSKATGSSPRRVRSSLTTSSISRKDISWLMSLASYVTNCPGVVAFLCRQIRNVRFISNRTYGFHKATSDRLFGQLRELIDALEFPPRHVSEFFVVAQRLAVFGLILFAEVAAARLLA